MHLRPGRTIYLIHKVAESITTTSLHNHRPKKKKAKIREGEVQLVVIIIRGGEKKNQKYCPGFQPLPWPACSLHQNVSGRRSFRITPFLLWTALLEQKSIAAFPLPTSKQGPRLWNPPASPHPSIHPNPSHPIPSQAHFFSAKRAQSEAEPTSLLLPPSSLVFIFP